MVKIEGQPNKELPTEPSGLTVMNGKKTAGQPLTALANRPRLLKRAYSTLRFDTFPSIFQ